MKKEIDLGIMIMGIIGSLTIIGIMLISAIQDKRLERIKYLEQSLNEQIEEKQVYMNMLEERSNIQ